VSVDVFICMTVGPINIGEQHLKKSNNIIGSRLIIVGVAILAIFTGIFFWWKDALTPVDDKDTTPISFTIPSGQRTKEIAVRLAEEDVIRNQIAFYLYVRFGGAGSDLQAGEFRLNRAMDTKTIAKELTRGTLDVWVTIPEGWRVEEIATKLTKELDIPEQEFLKYANEGYMFPDTYMIPNEATAGAVAALLQDTFNTKLTQEMVNDAKRSGLSKESLVTIASLVEREGKNSEDRPMIAGILLNRLHQDWPLQVDATLQYALGYQSSEKTWWKKELTDYDKTIDSPYNTYKYTGLPPGPIANPGVEALRAVVYPTTTEYMFYLHDSSGKAYYAKTVEEHERNIANYLR